MVGDAAASVGAASYPETVQPTSPVARDAATSRMRGDIPITLGGEGGDDDRPASPDRAGGDALTPDRTVRYVYRADPGCHTPVIGPFAGGIRRRVADQERPWTVEDGDEIQLHPLRPEDRLLLVSGPQMD